MHHLTTLIALCFAVLSQTPLVASVSHPSSNCYAFDNSSRLVDFSSWIGYPFEYDQKQGSDLAVRFCKDVESRSQTGYVDFGRFDKFNYFVAGSGQSDFVQEFYNGDLMGCEKSYDKMGRTAQLGVGPKKGDQGNVTRAYLIWQKRGNDLAQGRGWELHD